MLLSLRPSRPLSMILVVVAAVWLSAVDSLSPSTSSSSRPATRRKALGWILTTATTASTMVTTIPAFAEENEVPKIPDRFDVDNFLRTGLVAQPMGVSGQAGKSRPETGILLRDGSEVSRDSRTGDVLAEILLQAKAGKDMVPVLASYQSPWPLATGTVFDVECRDPKTGDGVFLQATSTVKGKALTELQDSFFVNSLVGRTGRFSLYGTPTDVKVRQAFYAQDQRYRVLDLSFATLSQSTQTEIPRQARVVATIPEGTDQAVLLVASASALRWKNKGLDTQIASVADSFRAIPAPQTLLRVRAKERRS